MRNFLLIFTTVFSINTLANEALFPVRTDSQMTLLSAGQDSLEYRLKSLRNARKSIWIQALVFSADESGKYISEILKEKKKQGLDVRIIVDAPSNMFPIPNEAQDMYFELKMAGIEVEGYEWGYVHFMNDSAKLINYRFHDKMWIVDAGEVNATAVVGGLNIANEYFRVGKKPEKIWRDQDIAVKGSVVGDIAKAFDQNYAYLKDFKVNNPLYNTDTVWEKFSRPLLGWWKVPDWWYDLDKEVTEEVQKIENRNTNFHFEKVDWAQFVQSRPRHGETHILKAYEKAFNEAKDEILITNAYFLPTDELKKLLLETAKKPNIKITIITNSPETNDLPELTLAGRQVYRELIDAGILIYEWQGHKFNEGTNHSKFAVIDSETSIIGSYNFDPRSQNLNSETVLILKNKSLSTQLATIFKGPDLAKSRLITPRDADSFINDQSMGEYLRLMAVEPFKGSL